MMPILLLSNNAKQINTYIADFVKKQSIIPSSIFQYRKNPNVISIEQIREIQWHLARASSIHRLFILYDFETARKETQNAFLKTLEEQGYNAYFILISPSEGQILSTVLSRCVMRKLKVKSLPRSGISLGGKKLKVHLLKKDDFWIQSLAQLFAAYTVTDREKALRWCDEFLIMMRDMMRVSKENIALSSIVVTTILKEILKTRNLILKNNLNAQSAIDHLLYAIKSKYPLTKMRR